MEPGNKAVTCIVVLGKEGELRALEFPDAETSGRLGKSIDHVDGTESVLSEVRSGGQVTLHGLYPAWACSTRQSSVTSRPELRRVCRYCGTPNPYATGGSCAACGNNG